MCHFFYLYYIHVHVMIIIIFVYLFIYLFIFLLPCWFVCIFVFTNKTHLYYKYHKAISKKCFSSHGPPSSESGSVGRAKTKTEIIK